MDRRRFLGQVGGAAGGLALGGLPPTRAFRPGTQPSGRFAFNDRIAALQAAGDERLWRILKAQFVFPADYAYLNTAGLGACPFVVSNTVKAMMDREEENPSATHSETDWARIRGKLAATLGPGCSADEIALVSTATEGINVILNGLGLSRGDEVITSTHEHPAVNIALLLKRATAGIEIRTFEPDLARAQGNVDRIAALFTPRTRVVFISHVTCTTGQLFPVPEIARLAAPRNIRVALDGAQSLCQLPIDIAASGADYYTASGHKFLMGPKRTGILYVKRDRIESLTPTTVGSYSEASWSMPERHLALRPNAQRYEYGTQNDALIYGLETAADLVSSIGLPAIWEHNRALAEQCYEGLRKLPGVDLLSAAEPEARTAILSFRIRNRTNSDVAAELGRNRIRVRVVSEAGLNAIRVSFHIFNDAEQVGRLLDQVGRLAGRPTRP